MANIKIIFYGPMSRKAGINELVMEVGTDFTNVIEIVKNEVTNRVGDKVPYTILINGVAYTTIDQNQYIVKDGDEYVILLIMAGG